MTIPNKAEPEWMKQPKVTTSDASGTILSSTFPGQQQLR